MTTRDAVLLIIKQTPGIEYNSLLNQLISSYKDINSARAALSRTLKDLRAFGFVTKEKSRLYTTEKASGAIYSEMKSKLILRLNELVVGRASEPDIEQIVKLLQTLIERSKIDADLLKAARGSTTFFIHDLEQLGQVLDDRISHYNYLSKVFKDQVNALKSLDFPNVRKLQLTQESLSTLSKLFEKTNIETVTLACQDLSALEKLAAVCETKAKENTVSFPKAHLPKALNTILELSSNTENLSFTFYLPPIEARLRGGSIYFSGTHSVLQNVLG